MNYKQSVFIIASAILFSMVLFACSSALYEPDLKYVKDEALLAELKEGRKLYTQKCGNCHNLFLPDKHTSKEWEYWLGIMGKKAKLKEQEKSDIYKYLTFHK